MTFLVNKPSYLYNFYVLHISASCTYPLLKQDIVQVGDYREPLLNSTILIFSCPLGLVLTGPNTTTCMENGEWEPDLSLVNCIGEFINTTIKYEIINNISPIYTWQSGSN